MTDHIVVGDVSPRTSVVLSAAQVDVTVPFKFFSDEDVTVYIDEVAQVLTTDFSVTGAGQDTGTRKITLVTPAVGGEVCTIVRRMVIKRETDYTDSGSWTAARVNDDFDKLVMMAQENSDDIARSLRLSDADADATLILPVAAYRASRYMGFDADGNVIVGDVIGTWKGDWATGVPYVVGDVVRDAAAGANTANLYRCSVSHTSGVWATDLAAPKWSLILDVASANAAKLAAETAQGLSEDARDASVIAQGLSEDARDASVIAQGLSEDARDAAASSASAAAASAAAADVAKIEWQAGGWLTATAYAVNDAVSKDGSSYICLVAHTSGTFATDLAAVKWELLAQKGTDGAGSGTVTTAGTGLALSGGGTTLGADVASQAEAEAGTASTKLMTPERTAQAIAALAGGGSPAGKPFLAYIGATQTLSTSTWTKVNFGSERFDVGGYFDTTNYRFTPAAGKWFIGAEVLFDSSMTDQDQARLIIYKNGAGFIRSDFLTGAASEQLTVEVSGLVDANGTDYYEVYAWQNSGGNVGLSSLNEYYSRFFGFQVG